MPRVVHEHQDAHGNTTGFTVVHTESEWDDSTRDRVERDAEYRASLCPCGCGIPAAQAWDPFYGPWAVDSFTCYARKALEQIRRQWEDSHKNQQGDSWRDGVEHFVVPAEGAEHDVEKAEKSASVAEMRRRARGGD